MITPNRKISVAQNEGRKRHMEDEAGSCYIYSEHHESLDQ